MTGAEMMAIAREYFPDSDDNFVEGILWEHTGAPCFLSDPMEANLRQQLACMADAVKHGYRACTLCSKPVREGKWDCDSCEAALHRAREAD